MFQLPRFVTPRSHGEIFKGLPSFHYSSIKKGPMIGAGSYGNVYEAMFKGKRTVVKELEGAEEKDLIKEAKFHNNIIHQNVVKFIAVCKQPRAIMLEYVYFDFAPFGKDLKVSGLDKLLAELEQCHFQGFRHLVPCIAKDLVNGLEFLHCRGIAHRDLKPGNILVSNQHFLNINDPIQKGTIWKSKPCVSKLTDFGESWGRIAQSSYTARSSTVNIFKGTAPFMAPEVLDPAKRKSSMLEEDLKRADIWSLGMTLFCLVNPAFKIPYFKEARESGNIRNWDTFLLHKVSNYCVPEEDNMYNSIKATEWISVQESSMMCLKGNPNERPSLGEVKTKLGETILSLSFPLKIHQGSAFEDAYPTAIEGAFFEPLNDGNNACVFFACKLSELILHKSKIEWMKLTQEVEDIISKLPITLNKYREKERCYDPTEAYELMLRYGLITKLTLNELTNRDLTNTIYSPAGMSELRMIANSVQKVAILTVPPYSFLVGKEGNEHFIIDTHKVSPDCDGNYNGIVKVFQDCSSCCKWIWKRLESSGIKDIQWQAFEVRSFERTEEIHGRSSPSMQTPLTTEKSILEGSDNVLRSDNASSDDVIDVESEVLVKSIECNVGEVKEKHDPKRPTKLKGSVILIDSDESLEDSNNEILQPRQDVNIQSPVQYSVHIHGSMVKDAKANSVTGHSTQSQSIRSLKKLPNASDMSYTERWREMEISKFGLYDLPCVENKNTKLKFGEQLALIRGGIPKANRVPQACRKNAIFLIDNSKLKHPDDVLSDLNGVYKQCLEVKNHVVEITESCQEQQKVKVYSNKKVELQENQWYLKVNRKKNHAGLIRSVSYFIDSLGQILEDAIIVQYIVDQKVCGDVSEIKFNVKPHGNAKKNECASYYPLKKSTISSLHEGISASGKGCLGNVFKAALNKGSASDDFGDRPRSKHQVWAMAGSNPEKNRNNPKNEVEMILAYNEELAEEGFVWHHSDIPNDMWVLGTQRMVDDLSHAEDGPPISIDPTFNHGMYEVTPLTYRNQLVLAKSKNIRDQWSNAVMIGPVILHHGKFEETFDRGIREIARKTCLNGQQIGIITDGEQALINACIQNMPKSVQLRCTAHFKENCKGFLKGIGIKGDRDQAPFLEIVFGANGLIEANDKDDLRDKLTTQTAILDEIEKSYLNHPSKYKPKFSTYLKEREESVLGKMTCDVRLAGGIPYGVDGRVQRVYTHQSETVNSMLAAKKLALGFPKKVDLSKTQFICSVWQEAVREQQEEIERALYGQSENYKLAKEAEYLKVEVEDWFNWNETTRKRYVFFFILQDGTEKNPPCYVTMFCLQPSCVDRAETA